MSKPYHLLVQTLIALSQYTGWMYAGVNSTILSGVIIGVISQVWLRKYHSGWYREYNYILGGKFWRVISILLRLLIYSSPGAFDGGAQVLIFVLSFAVYGASGVAHPFPSWWGNPAGNADHCMEL